MPAALLAIRPHQGQNSSMNEHSVGAIILSRQETSGTQERLSALRILHLPESQARTFLPAILWKRTLYFSVCQA